MKTVESPRAPLRNAPMWPMSVAAYHALGEAGLIPKNTELLYGFVYRKIPKSPLHCYLLQKLLQLLSRLTPAKYLLRSEQPITCAESEPETDLSVVKGSIEDFRLDHPHTAELVIEVCVTSVEYDRWKLSAYAAAGVKECWLVLAETKQIQVYRQPVGDKFAESVTHGPGGKLVSSSVPEFAIELDALFNP
jgi:Uma2 family endonuclease